MILHFFKKVELGSVKQVVKQSKIVRFYLTGLTVAFIWCNVL